MGEEANVWLLAGEVKRIESGLPVGDADGDEDGEEEGDDEGEDEGEEVGGGGGGGVGVELCPKTAWKPNADSATAKNAMTTILFFIIF